MREVHRIRVEFVTWEATVAEWRHALGLLPGGKASDRVREQLASLPRGWDTQAPVRMVLVAEEADAAGVSAVLRRIEDAGRG